MPGTATTAPTRRHAHKEPSNKATAVDAIRVAAPGAPKARARPDTTIAINGGNIAIQPAARLQGG
eukprot:3167815-Alexandrium_andersonii.AAC.1